MTSNSLNMTSNSPTHPYNNIMTSNSPNMTSNSPNIIINNSLLDLYYFIFQTKTWYHVFFHHVPVQCRQAHRSQSASKLTMRTPNMAPSGVDFLHGIRMTQYVTTHPCELSRPFSTHPAHVKHIRATQLARSAHLRSARDTRDTLQSTQSHADQYLR